MLSNEARSVLTVFDYTRDEATSPVSPDIPLDGWRRCVVLGPSGTGKTTALERFGHTPIDIRSDVPVIDLGDPSELARLYQKVGFSSVPSWTLYYRQLSNGEKYRVQLAHMLLRGDDPIVLDEFGSYLDELAGIALARVVRRLSSERRFLIATLSPTIAAELEPDLLVETGTPSGRLVQRRSVELELVRLSHSAWSIFRDHHYMTDDHRLNTRCFGFLHRGSPVAFLSLIPFPGEGRKSAWREHRLVVLPAYQGMGLGLRLSEAVAACAATGGSIVYGKTVHPALGAVRNARPDRWQRTKSSERPISTSREVRPSDIWKFSGTNHTTRQIAYSHYWIGGANEAYASLWHEHPTKGR